jgi:DNA-binding HxlR family transcriptional regulator
MEPDRIYRHFCMMARALELVGERWSLLIVRDLLLGPRRFTDLARGLAEITPTRLTNRLRQLEEAGLVTRQSPAAGREVWYQLTDAGRDLWPVVDALTLWGIQHALEPPREGEPVQPVPAMIGTKVVAERHTPRLPRPAVWVWRFLGEDSYQLSFDNGGWSLSRGEAESASVIVEATPEAWARFLTLPRGRRRLPRAGVRLSGKAAALKLFAQAFAAELED